MRARRARLYQHVRHATAPSASHRELIDDAAIRQLVFDTIVGADAADPPTATAAIPVRPVRRLVAATATAVAALVVATAAVAIGASHAAHPTATAPPASSRPAATPAPSGPLGGAGMAACVESYNTATLAERAFAFDGTVIDATSPAAGSESAPDTTAVTFRVNHWYRGGSVGEVTVAMFVGPGQATAEDTPVYRIGSRLLVSGEPRFGGTPLTNPVAWACGFTRWYTAVDAQAWQQTFG